MDEDVLSPGSVLVGTQMQVEAGLQYSIHQDVGAGAAEGNIRFVPGLTMKF